jgi:transcriptional regulator with XRE-family HTH domain
MDNHIREEKVMTDKRKTQYKQLGLNIAYYRRLKGLTQSDLAEAVNLSRNHISNMEAPGMRTSISIEKLLDIADVLEVPVKKFFDFRD